MGSAFDERAILIISDNGAWMTCCSLFLLDLCLKLTQAMSAEKRWHEEDPTVENVMYFGRFIMEKDPFKDRAPDEESRAFTAMFWCRTEIVLILWNKLVFYDLLPSHGQMKHFLWTLSYWKTYAKRKTIKKLTDTDPKTLRRWINLFYKSIEELCPYVVSCRGDYSYL